jgi:hypothetical protein
LEEEHTQGIVESPQESVYEESHDQFKSTEKNEAPGFVASQGM